jgi:hypothetical protein
MVVGMTGELVWATVEARRATEIGRRTLAKKQ